MDFAWVPPEEDYLKINVHSVRTEHLLFNGNVNGVSAIIRDQHGTKLWGAAGATKDRTLRQALLWGIQAAAVQCLRMGHQRIYIETDNREAFDIIRFLDENLYRGSSARSAQAVLHSSRKSLHRGNYVQIVCCLLSLWK
ncbi:hypothetical protein POM88_036832 [Heracleum sosnowskyi]|uniref:RNase H type-1 domain-containing protein n=1 Tax=Heracleum sosnowskyi TaxID=360622 RepID=A0AAD8MCR8_9APIA|nr:hypothetical protein POM88_036832 [Heracleum sosnowskyi]